MRIVLLNSGLKRSQGVPSASSKFIQERARPAKKGRAPSQSIIMNSNGPKDGSEMKVESKDASLSQVCASLHMLLVVKRRTSDALVPIAAEPICPSGSFLQC